MTEAEPDPSRGREPGADTVGGDLGDELVERFSGDETDAPPSEIAIISGDESEVLEYGKIDRGFTLFAKWCSYLAGVALGVVTVVCFIDVILSKLGQGGIPSQFELIANLNLVMVFLAVFYVQMDRGSVSIELAQDHFPTPLKLGVRLFGSLLGAAVSFFCAYRGWYYLADFWETHKSASGVWHFPIWPAQAVLVFGFFCLGIAFLFTISRDVTNCRLKRGKYAPRPQKRTKQAVGPTPEQASKAEGQI